MDKVLALVQRHHLSLQSMQKWLDSAAALLQRVSSEVELENHTDCMLDLEEISAQEKRFTAGLEEQRTLDSLLVDFMEPRVMSGLREKVEKLHLRNTEVKHQLDAYREVLQRCVLMSSYVHYCSCLYSILSQIMKVYICSFYSTFTFKYIQHFYTYTLPIFILFHSVVGNLCNFSQMCSSTELLPT